MNKYLLILLSLAALAFGRDEELIEPADMLASPTAILPRVVFETENNNLYKAFYPEYAPRQYEVDSDSILIAEKSAPLIAAWDTLGESVLKCIAAESGVPWTETHLKLYLLKYLPIAGLYDPLALPLQGVKIGGKIEAASTGWMKFLQLIQILSARNLKGIRNSNLGDPIAANHPLLRPGTYRFDLLAMSLALSCASHLLPPDTLRAILGSELWRRYNPGYLLYKDYVENKWNYSERRPLVYYLRNEPYNSDLVKAAEFPEYPEGEIIKRPTAKGKPLPSAGKGRLGFSVVRGRGGAFDVVYVDDQRLAYACGLRGGDRIIRVNGETVKTRRELMARILEGLDAGGSYLTILRDKETKGILLSPAPLSPNE
jgi:hypothetical protein